MDLSKLPKMSDTRRAEADRQAEAPPQSGMPVEPTGFGEPSAPPRPARVVQVESGGSGWISLIVGLLVLLFWPRLWQWIAAKLFGTAFTWTFTNPDGSPLAYEDSYFFWGDLAIALFGIALLVEGLVLLVFARVRSAIWLSLVIVASAVLLNVGFVVFMLAQGFGLQLPSLLAVIFGAFMCVQQWQLLQGPRHRYLLIEE